MRWPQLAALERDSITRQIIAFVDIPEKLFLAKERHTERIIADSGCKRSVIGMRGHGRMQRLLKEQGLEPTSKRINEVFVSFAMASAAIRTTTTSTLLVCAAAMGHKLVCTAASSSGSTLEVADCARRRVSPPTATAPRTGSPIFAVRSSAVSSRPSRHTSSRGADAYRRQAARRRL